MQKIYQIEPGDPNADIINLAATILDKGGIAVFPTETVYGIGAEATNMCYGPHGLFDIKQRSYDKPIPWLVEDESALATYGVDVPEYAYRLAHEFWPGALTIVVKASDAVNPDFRAKDGTIALRSPDNPIAQALIRATGYPLITSSANTHGLPPATDFKDIEPRIIEAVDIALDAGPTSRQAESTVVLCTGDKPTIWREKAISSDEIFAVLQDA